MSISIVVIEAFEGFARGDCIEDDEIVAGLLAGDRRPHFVVTVSQDPVEAEADITQIVAIIDEAEADDAEPTDTTD